VSGSGPSCLGCRLSCGLSCGRCEPEQRPKAKVLRFMSVTSKPKLPNTTTGITPLALGLMLLGLTSISVPEASGQPSLSWTPLKFSGARGQASMPSKNVSASVSGFRGLVRCVFTSSPSLSPSPSVSAFNGSVPCRFTSSPSH